MRTGVPFLNQDKYINLRTGAGRTRQPTKDWMNASQGQLDDLIKSAEADEAVALLYQTRPGGGK
jgi:hypothetical protein